MPFPSTKVAPWGCGVASLGFHRAPWGRGAIPLGVHRNSPPTRRLTTTHLLAHHWTATSCISFGTWRSLDCQLTRVEGRKKTTDVERKTCVGVKSKKRGDERRNQEGKQRKRDAGTITSVSWH